MKSLQPQIYRPGYSLSDQPRFFVQTPDDLDEDKELNRRPGSTGILRAILRLVRRSGSQDRSVVCTCRDVAVEAGVIACAP